MKNFFGSCLGAVVGVVVVLGLALVILIGSVASEKEAVVRDNSVLHIKLDNPISELELEEPLADVFPGSVQERTGLIQLKQAINAAKNDPKIKGIYLNASYVMAGFATIEELRRSLTEFRESGKWVVAYGDFYSEGGYYLSSAADKVYLNPAGQLELNGLVIQVTFFKKLFDKLDVKPQVFRVGEFKGAVEPFVREDLSQENKLQLTEMVNGIYEQEITGISESRNIPRERVKEIADKMLVRLTAQAVEFGLVDSLFYDDQVKDEIRGRLGLATDKRIPFTKYEDYKKTIPANNTSKNEIAVIVVDGEILPGKMDDGIVGSATIREEIRKARTSERVKAILIRVNSPGGAFTAADEMWREIDLARKEKPVIASMGDYAASGGYYLAMACDTIVAQPATITGSIGVFSVLFDMSSFLGNKLGITTEQIKTGQVGNLITFTRPLSNEEKSIWQAQTEEVYDIFIRKAAAGRGVTPEKIRNVASGRVWTGKQAAELDLVDALGSFDEAVQIAVRAAGVEDDYKLRFYPTPKNFFEKLMSDPEEDIRSDVIRDETGEYYEWYQQWQKVKNYHGTQARLPVEFSIH